MPPSEVLSAYRSDDLRAAEARVLADLPDGTLMRRAAAKLATVCLDVLRQRHGGVYGRRVVLLVGTGNNGADALLAGAILQRRGAAVTAFLTGDWAYPPGLLDLALARGRVVVDVAAPGGMAAAQAALADADLVMDGIVGISGTGGLREPADKLVADIPPGVPVVAVDLPSGVDPDTGEIDGPHVRADVTVTFGAFKPCLLLPPAAHVAGRVVFVDVGVAGQLDAEPVVQRMTAGAVAARWPVPGPDDHKYTRGVLGVVAGSDTYPGAAVLAVAGAVRAGVGVARYVGPQRVTDHVLAAWPEAVPGKGRVQAWLLGSGVENDAQQYDAIERALKSGLPCVVDAGALDACVRQRQGGRRPAASDQVLLTPHAGELARMLEVLGHEVSRDQVQAQPLHHALWLAEEADATVLLKGSTTLIAAPDGRVLSQNEGPAWMATAGSGDVLAGIAGMLMTAGEDALSAGAMAAFVHGRAGAKASAGGPCTASGIADATPAVIAELLRMR